MFQSPRGSIDIIAQNSFDIQNPDIRDIIDRQNINHIDNDTDNSDSTNQLVWSNPITQSLHQQTLCLVAYSNTLLYMAESAKSPLGLNSFWEAGATPSTEWKQWFSKIKMAIMARDNIEVDKLLKLKPQATDLFYPTLPTYEDEFEGEKITKQGTKNKETKEGESILRTNAS